MKVETKTEDVCAINTGAKLDYQIAHTREVYDYYSRKLYQNAPVAIVRELACNALDAHVEAGHTKPFDLEITSKKFRIRDYGTGLPKQKMEELYRTYGMSGKRHTNDLIGGLGLGSKSPYAYCDSFITISYYNGKKHMYANTKNKEGIPQLIQLHKDYPNGIPTDEPNGLEIQFDLNNPGDKSAFEDAAKRVFKYFPYHPPSVKTDKPEYQHYFKGIGGIDKNHDHSGSSINAIMGNIKYPINTNQVSLGIITRRSYYSYQSHYVYLDLFFDIGELDFVTSREALEYNDKTKAAIEKKYKQYIAKCEEQFNKSIKHIKSVGEFFKFYASNKENLLVKNNLVNLDQLKFKGKTAREYFADKLYPEKNDSDSVICFNLSKYDNKLYKERYLSVLDINVLSRDMWTFEPNKVIVNDKPSYYKMRLKKYMEDNSINHATIISPKMASKWEKVLGTKFDKHLSDLPKPDIQKKAVNSKLSDYLVYAKGGTAKRTNSEKSTYWDAKSLDLTKEKGVYCRINNYDLVNCKIERNDLFAVLTFCEAVKIPVPTIVGTKKSSHEQFEDSKNWIHLDEWIQAVAEKFRKLRDYRSILCVHADIDSTYDKIILGLSSTNNLIKSYIKTKQEYDKFGGSKVDRNTAHLYHIFKKYLDFAKETKQMDNIVTRQKDNIEKLEKRYPVITLSPTSYTWQKDYNENIRKVIIKTLNSLIKGEKV